MIQTGPGRHPVMWLKAICLAIAAASASASGPAAAAAQALEPPLAVPPPPSLPALADEGHVHVAGARIWYGSIGRGRPVVLLHGGMSSSRAWGAQVPALVQAGYRVVLVDSRGHGRSTMGKARLSYARMANDVRAVIRHLRLSRPTVVGWSDGAIVALTLAANSGETLGGIYAFGANIDASGVRPDAASAPILAQVGPWLAADYADISPTPGDFGVLRSAVREMQGQEPFLSHAQLREIRASPVLIAGAAEDEFILPAHQQELAGLIPGAELEIFRNGGHFVPWQEPESFNRSLLAFLSSG